MGYLGGAARVKPRTPSTRVRFSDVVREIFDSSSRSTHHFFQKFEHFVWIWWWNRSIWFVIDSLFLNTILFVWMNYEGKPHSPFFTFALPSFFNSILGSENNCFWSVHFSHLFPHSIFFFFFFLFTIFFIRIYLNSFITTTIVLSFHIFFLLELELEFHLFIWLD